MGLRLLEARGPVLTQDLGRPGWSDQGVGPSGVFDRRALRQVNVALGNPEGAAGLEVLGGGTVLVATLDHDLAVAGAAGPVWVDDQPMDTSRVVHLTRGHTVRLGTPTVGARWVVGVAGGIDVPPVLGSRSRDTLAELGPAPWRVGDLIAVGIGTRAPGTVTFPPLLGTSPVRVRVRLGPRDDWFTEDALAALLTEAWTVSPLADRVGIRLDGAPLLRRRTGELLSEPVVRGAIQVTGDGTPIILGPDHPVTGGYPVIAVVVDRDLDLLAHVRPGDTVRLERRHPT